MEKPEGTSLYPSAYSFISGFEDLSISRCIGTGAEGEGRSRSISLVDVSYSEARNTGHIYYPLMPTGLS